MELSPWRAGAWRCGVTPRASVSGSAILFPRLVIRSPVARSIAGPTGGSQKLTITTNNGRMAAPPTLRDPASLADEIATLVPAIRSDVLRRLVAHWQRVRGGRAMPARSDFDPFDVRFAV